MQQLYRTTKAKYLSKTFLLSLLCFFTLACRAQTVIYYVDSTTGDDSHTGASWSAAYRNVSKALFKAKTSTAPHVEIWVAKGTYYPVTGIPGLPFDDIDTAFAIYRGNGIGKSLKLYGGFAGTEASISARDTLHKSILDGLIGAYPLLASTHVAVIAGLSKFSDSLIIDNFTISHAAGGIDENKNYNGVAVPDAYGGGLSLVKDSTNKLAIRNCVFSGNSSIGGGGLYIEKSIVNISGCSFTANTALNYGAGIYNMESSPHISNCNFAVNTCDGGYYYSLGGAIYNSYSSPIIRSCNFTSNVALGYYPYGDFHGGAICNVLSSAPIIDSCIFVSNMVYAGARGGAGNAYGGAVYNQGCSPLITNCSFIGNKAIARANMGDPGGYAYGGAVYNDGNNSNITNCFFSANGAFGYGYIDIGSSYAYGGAICNVNSNYSINHCIFTSDTAYGYSYYFPEGIHGYATGGGIYNYSTSLLIDSSHFTNEVAMGDNGNGGAIGNVYTGPISIDHSFFSGNSASINGGAAYISGGVMSFKNSVFDGNTASGGGGIMAAASEDLSVSLTANNNVFSENVSSANGGGAVSVYGGQDSLIDNVFISNKDTSATGGGALYLIGSFNYIVNNTFYKDSALSAPGGAIGGSSYSWAEGSIIANDLFFNNYGFSGGADTDGASTITTTYIHNEFGSTDPLFVDGADPIGADSIWGTADDGIKLQQCSPAANGGSNMYVLPWETTDVAGLMRISGDSVDIGAYELHVVGSITGIHDICLGATTTMYDTTAGGTWFSTDTAIATISASGIVTGVSIGADTILYIVNSLCRTDTIVKPIAIISSGNAGIIMGPSLVCVGAYITLTDSITDGTWSLTNAHAAISGSTVSGISAGADTVIYTNGCGSAADSMVITINPLPVSGVITGNTMVCTGDTIVLSDTSSGGVWSFIYGYAYTNDSEVIGNFPGTEIINYTVTNACGVAETYYTVTVNALPPPFISGSNSVCVGTEITLSDTAAGGTWSSVNTNATVSTSGVVTGISPGYDSILYTATNICGTTVATQFIIVSLNATHITGPRAVCANSSATLYDSPSGGRWLSSDNDIISIDPVSGIYTGITPGTDTITYTTPNGCVAYVVDTVKKIPGTIDGVLIVCAGSVITLTDTPSSGVWTGSNSSISVNASTGAVTGNTPDTATVIYTLHDGCFSTVSVTVDSCALSVQNTNVADQTELFPNPVNNVLHVRFTSGITHIVIIDQLGQKLFSRQYPGVQEISVNVADLVSGVYFIGINDNEYLKFIKR